MGLYRNLYIDLRVLRLGLSELLLQMRKLLIRADRRYSSMMVWIVVYVHRALLGKANSIFKYMHDLSALAEDILNFHMAALYCRYPTVELHDRATHHPLG